MATSKNYFRVEMTVEASALHAVTAAADGKALDVSIRPVVHKEARSVPRTGARAAVIAWLATRSKATTSEIIGQATALGFGKAVAYSTITTLIKEKAIKRTAPGQYNVLAALKSKHKGKESK